MQGKEQFMHKLYETKTGRNFREAKAPEDILVLFQSLGYHNIPLTLAQRLSYLSLPNEQRNSHFQDALEISEIIDDLLPEELSETELNELRAASLAHDVGKSGPAEATPEEQLAYVAIFNLNFPYGQLIDGVKINDVTIKQALDLKVAEGEVTAERAEEILELAVAASGRQQHERVETKITPETTMGTFWSAHVYWTYDLLQQAALPKTLIDTAASHHHLEGHDPANIGLENATGGMVSLELADKYQAYRIRLLLADKYQAFMQRSGRTHEETIEIMRKRIEEFFRESPPGLERIQSLYLKVLEQINQKKEVFARELDLST